MICYCCRAKDQQQSFGFILLLLSNILVVSAPSSTARVVEAVQAARQRQET